MMKSVKFVARPALRGTEEYKFMEGKLHEYIRHMQEEADIKAKELEEKPLFEGQCHRGFTCYVY